MKKLLSLLKKTQKPFYAINLLKGLYVAPDFSFFLPASKEQQKTCKL